MSLLPLVVLLAAQMGLDQKGIFTRPTIHGDSVVFTCEGDLWLGNLKSSTAARLTRDAGLETSARFSPDGKQVAFVGQYDGTAQVYVMDVEGGEPRRLTWESGVENIQGWTPDGKNILFRKPTADPQNFAQIMQVPATGGQVQRLALPRGEFASINAKGQVAYVPVSMEWANWFRYEAGAADQLWLADLKGGFRRLTNGPGIDTMPVWCGNDLYAVSERAGQLNLFKYDTANGRATQITKNTTHPVRYPDSDGKRLIFEAGPFLSIYDPATSATLPVRLNLLSDRIHSREQLVPLAAGVGGGNLGPTAKRIVLESRGQIVTLPLDKGAMRVVDGESGSRAILPKWSPDGRNVIYFSDRTGEYELWTTAADGSGEPKQVTKGFGGNPGEIIFSPDSKRVAVSDREQRIHVIDLATGAMDRVHTHPFAGSYDVFPNNLAFSPNGKLLVFNGLTPAFTTTVGLVDLDQKKVKYLTRPGYFGGGGAFSPDGKWLLIAADRDFGVYTNPAPTQKFSFDKTARLTLFALDRAAKSPFLPENVEEPIKEEKKEEKKDEKPAEPKKDEPFVYDLESLEERWVDVPVPTGRYNGPMKWVGDRLIVAEQEEFGVPSLRVLSIGLKKKDVIEIASGVANYELSADNSSILLQSPAGLAVGPLIPGPVPAKPVRLSSYTLSVDPKKEWKQIFRETWRVSRDFFYDPGMHGADWNAIWAKYEPQLAHLGDRSDLTRLQKDLVSELRCGHAYVGGGGSFTPGATPRPIGLLGIDASPAERGIKIDRILRGPSMTFTESSPLGDPTMGVKEGDFILAINGKSIDPKQDYRSLLVGTVGQTVLLTVNSKPSLEGSRTVAVEPIGNERALRLADHVRQRGEYVKAKTGGKVGYVYVGDMVETGQKQWTGQIMSELEKEAVVFDFRGNGGGYISSILLDQLNIKPLFYFQPRKGETWRRENWALRGAKVALCNEYNFSDGELVIEAWKKLGLGPVVGKRTGGGEVGSGGGYRLKDGGSVYVPNYAAFDFEKQKWVIEGYGATPTVEVDQDAAKALQGIDSQLDKAIELAIAEAKKNPVKPVSHPPFPKVGN